MLGENKNLKDASGNTIKDTNPGSTSLALSWREHSKYYSKTNKLITALYMVTDTMEKEEPIRLKLRTLGVEILSDTNSSLKGTLGNLDEKITALLSFLSIASDMRMISEMNSNILAKEFVELKQSVKEFTTQNHLWLEEFLSNEGPAFAAAKASPSFLKDMSFSKGHEVKGGTRIGVQKGSTLLHALERVARPGSMNTTEGHDDFEILKSKRRALILKIIKGKTNGASIKDIVLAIKNLGEVIGEKTLQRELVSMVSDNILYRTGSKRWSLYFLQ